MAYIWIVILSGLALCALTFGRNDIDVPVPCVWHQYRIVCSCYQKLELVDCSSQDLSVIPKIDFKFKSLKMRNNSLTHLSLDLFKSIKDKGSFRLDFSHNNIDVIENNSLSVFTNLAFLDLSSNPLTNEALKIGLWNINDYIQSLSLANLKLDRFDDRVFEPLRSSRLQHLDVQYNKFNYVHTNQLFEFLPYLRVLNFSNNYIKEFNFTHSKTLNMLRLTRNDITEVPSFCNGEKPIFPNLKILYLDKNCLFHITPQNVDCLKKLESLNISQTNMHYLPDNIFNKLTSLKSLTLEYSSSLQYIHRYAFNSSSLERIFIRNNGLYFSYPYLDPEYIFSSTPKLSHLDISGNILGKMSYSQWKKMLQKLRRLVYLDISQAELEFLPLAVSDYLHDLYDLRAGFNGIKRVNSDFFKPLKKLSILYLNGNKITRVYKNDLPENLKVLNLGYNPYICDCKLLWFLNYLKVNKKIVRYYPKLYNCSTGIHLADFKITEKSCLLSQNTNTIIISTCYCFVALIIIVSLIFRYRWRLRYFYHVLNFNRRKYFNPSGQTFLHDIYVVCADRSCEATYIKENLVTILENDGKKVFFPKRDALPNKPTVTGTLEQMDRSKCILICISDAFSSDQLCEFQVNMALQRSIHDSECTVIVVILEEVSNVNKTINSLLRTHQNYLLWDEEREANVLFWRKFNEYID